MAEQPTIACPVCGAPGFEAPGSAPMPDDILTCQACGARLSYAFLQSRMAPAPQPKPPAPQPKPRQKKRPVRKARRK